MLHDVPTFPPGCTAAKLGDGVCDAGCDTRGCASDNRDCPAMPIVVSPMGDDSSATGTAVAPYRTLRHALHVACTGFIDCLPVHLMPGQYECSHLAANYTGFSILMQAADMGQPPPVLNCSSSADDVTATLRFDSCNVTLRHLVVHTAVHVGRASLLYLYSVQLGPGGLLQLTDSFLEGSQVTVTGGEVVTDFHRDRLDATTQALAPNGWPCPACQHAASNAYVVALRQVVLQQQRVGGGLVASLDVVNAEQDEAHTIAALVRGDMSLSGVTLRGQVHVSNGTLVLSHCSLPLGSSVIVTHGSLMATAVTIHGSHGSMTTFQGSMLPTAPDDVTAGGSSNNATLHCSSTGQLVISNAILSTPSGRVLESTDSGVDITLSHCALIGGGISLDAGDTGGYSSLAILHSLVQGTQAPEGAGVWANSVAVTVAHSSFLFNWALQLSGGGIFVTGPQSSLSVSHSHFMGNIAAGGGGGAILLRHVAVASIEDSVFNNNVGFTGGGAIHIHDTPTTVSRIHCFTNVDSFGGCMFVQFADSVIVRQAVMYGNIAFNGGAMLVRASVVEVHDCDIGGSSGFASPGVKVWERSTALINSTILRNCWVDSDDTGGALTVDAHCSVNVTNSLLTGNRGPEATALMVTASSRARLEGCKVTHNRGLKGAAIVVQEMSVLELVATSVLDNSVQAEEQPDFTVTAAPAGLHCYNSEVVMDEATTFARHHPYTAVCNDCLLASDSLNGTAPGFSMSCANQQEGQTWDVVTLSSAVSPTAGEAIVATLSHAAPPHLTVRAYVGGREVSDAVLGSASTVNLTTPQGTGANWTVQVFVEGKASSNVAQPQAVLRYARPALSEVSPAIAPAAGGLVTLLGSNFGPPGWDSDRDSVTINGVACGSPTRLDHGRIQCTSPPAVGVALPVAVTSGGQAGVTREQAVTIMQASQPDPPTFTKTTAVVDSTSGDAVAQLAAPLGAPSALDVTLVTTDAGGVPLQGYSVTQLVKDCSFSDSLATELAQLPQCAVGHVTGVSGDSSGSMTLYGLCTGCTYTLTAQVTNVANMTSTASHPTTVIASNLPAAPEIVATRRGLAWPSSMWVDVNPGGDGGAQVTNYVVSWSPQASFNPEEGSRSIAVANATTLAAGNATLGLHVAGFVPYREVFVRVRAVTSKGKGAFSTPVGTDVLIGVPSAPTIHQVHVVDADGAANTGRLRLFIEPPQDSGGRPLALYEARVYEVSSAAAWEERSGVDAAAALVFGTLQAVASSMSLADVAADGSVGSSAVVLQVDTGEVALGAWYGVTLAASNSHAETKYGTAGAVSSSVHAALAPEAPKTTEMVVTAFTTSAATVNVSFPAAVPRGSPVTAYRVAVARGHSFGRGLSEQVVWHNVSAADTATTLRVEVDVAFWDNELVQCVLAQRSCLCAALPTASHTHTLFVSCVQYNRAIVARVAAVSAVGVSAHGPTASGKMPCRHGFGLKAADGNPTHTHTHTAALWERCM